MTSTRSVPSAASRRNSASKTVRCSTALRQASATRSRSSVCTPPSQPAPAISGKLWPVTARQRGMSTSRAPRAPAWNTSVSPACASARYRASPRASWWRASLILVTSVATSAAPSSTPWASVAGNQLIVQIRGGPAAVVAALTSKLATGSPVVSTRRNRRSISWPTSPSSSGMVRPTCSLGARPFSLARTSLTRR